MFHRLAASTFLVTVLSGCFSTQVTLDYQPRPGMHHTGRPEVTVGKFYDNRGVAPFYIGTARNALGTPTEHVLLRVPADQAVRNAFLHALDARKMLSESGGKYYLAGEVEELRCQIYSRPFAETRIRLHVLDSSTDKIVFEKTYSSTRHGTNFQFGLNDPTTMMREITSRALQDAVDEALDDPALRRAIHQGFRKGRPKSISPEAIPTGGSGLEVR